MVTERFSFPRLDIDFKNKPDIANEELRRIGKHLKALSVGTSNWIYLNNNEEYTFIHALSHEARFVLVYESNAASWSSQSGLAPASVARIVSSNSEKIKIQNVSGSSKYFRIVVS